MPKAFKAGCERPKSKQDEKQTQVKQTGEIPAAEKEKEAKAMIKIGQKAPDFSAPAFYQGKFVNVDLAEYAGKWILLCFYPGDFTFV